MHILVSLVWTFRPRYRFFRVVVRNRPGSLPHSSGRRIYRCRSLCRKILSADGVAYTPSRLQFSWELLVPGIVIGLSTHLLFGQLGQHFLEHCPDAAFENSAEKCMSERVANSKSVSVVQKMRLEVLRICLSSTRPTPENVGILISGPEERSLMVLERRCSYQQSQYGRNDAACVGYMSEFSKINA